MATASASAAAAAASVGAPDGVSKKNTSAEASGLPLGAIGAALAAAPLAWIATKHLDGSRFSGHVASMWVAFAVIPTVSVCSIRMRASATTPEAQAALTQRHAGLQAVGAAAAIAGLAFIFQHKEANAKAHFTSLHSQLGLATVGLLSLNALGVRVDPLTGPRNTRDAG